MEKILGIINKAVHYRTGGIFIHNRIHDRCGIGTGSAVNPVAGKICFCVGVPGQGYLPIPAADGRILGGRRRNAVVDHLVRGQDRAGVSSLVSGRCCCHRNCNSRIHSVGYIECICGIITPRCAAKDIRAPGCTADGAIVTVACDIKGSRS